MPTCMYVCHVFEDTHKCQKRMLCFTELEFRQLLDTWCGWWEPNNALCTEFSALH